MSRGRGRYETRKVIVVETGKIYESASACADKIGVNRSSVCRCLRGEIYSCKGLTIRYFEEKKDV